MAVRRTRSSGNGPLIGLVVFVFLFIVALALAIIFYQQRAGQQQDFKQMRAEINELATTSERSSDEVEAVRQRAGEENRSVVQQLLTDVNTLKRLMAGDSSASIARIRQRVQSRLAELDVAEQQNILAALQAVEGKVQQMRSQMASMNQQIQAGEKTVAGMDQRFQEVRSSNQQTIQSLRNQVGKLQTAVQDYQQTAGNQSQQLQQRLASARKNMQGEIEQRDQRISELQDQLDQAQSRLDEMQQLVGAQQPQAPDQTEQPDGRIIDVNSRENLAYVNLGRRDHVVLGMTFEVFDSARGVQVSGGQGQGEGESRRQMRGKATIEIVDISDNSSAARIVRTRPNQSVLTDDVIANLVYDRDRQYKFYVFGRFDLNGDGQATNQEKQTVINQIKEWGGTVIDPEARRQEFTRALGEEAAQRNLLPVDTDFVVIGQEPQPPRGRGNQQAGNPQQASRGAEAQRRWQRFQQVISEAKALSIPVVNQNRFLALIGNYDR